MCNFSVKIQSMKKYLLTILIVMAIACLPVFASQITYRASSEEVKTMETLAVMTGTPIPSMTYPITGDNILQMLSEMDISRLSGPALKMYQELKESLENQTYLVSTKNKEFGIRLDLTVLAAEAWKGPDIQSGMGIPVASPGSVLSEAWNLQSISEFKDRLPVVSAEAVMNFSDYFAGDFRFDFGKNINTAAPLFGDVVMDSFLNLGFVEQDLVSKSYASMGIKNVNLIVGRDRLSAGRGKTGNLELGENQLYQDFAKLSALSYPFSYDFTLSVYDSYPDTYEWSDFSSYDEYSKRMLNTFSLNGPVKAVYIHRFSVSLFKRATLSFYEGAMAYGDGILSDPRVLNPFLFVHNTFSYRSGNINNFFGLEAEVNLPANLKLDIQAIGDQFRTSNEGSDSGENAFGVLANVSGSWVVGEGILSAYAEYVYNSPGLYLKEEYSHYPHDDSPLNTHTPFYKLDLITGFNHFYVSEYEYLGYKYGGDLSAFGLGASYLWHGQTFSADLFFLSKGEFGIGKGEQRALEDPDYTKTGERRNSFSVTAGVEGSIINGIDYKAKAGFIGKEFQFSVAFSIQPLKFIKK